MADKEHKMGPKIGELIYDTNDLGLAAYLKVAGVELKVMVRTGKKITFSFKDNPERKSFVDDYFTGKAKVNPLAYKNTIKDLKSYTFNN